VSINGDRPATSANLTDSGHWAEVPAEVPDSPALGSALAMRQEDSSMRDAESRRAAVR
jgi:hypothetical protein